MALPAIAVVAGLSSDGVAPVGDPGAQREDPRAWRSGDGRLPDLVDVSESFSSWRHDGTGSEVSGGAAIDDVDGDGVPDLVVGGGSAGVFFGEPATDSRRLAPVRRQFVPVLGEDARVLSVATGDLDADGATDLLFGTAADRDVIVWGGPWAAARTGAIAARTTLESGRPTTGLLPADLDGDGVLEIVRLGYGPDTGATDDLVWRQVSARAFDRVVLPNSDRRSLAAELVDIDGDGDVEIWVTRDVGWAQGADSVYDRLPSGREWIDIADRLGADLAVDGMGVTVADLTDDGVLDVYVSDLGDNEVLVGAPDRPFTPVDDIGVARIRPPGAGDSVISSSWASAAIDVNLDGRLDLVVANGGFGPDADIPNKIPGTSIAVDDPPAILVARRDGRYADVWPQLDLPWSGRARGMAAGDLDLDGDTDLAIVVHGEGLRVYRNDSVGRSVRVVTDPACERAGTTVTVRSDLGRITTLLSPHTFLGAHAVEVVAGVDGPATVDISRGSMRTTATVDAMPDRSLVSAACPG